MGERSEILLGVAIDLECREKRHVEIPRGKSEGGSLVALHNHGDVARAEFVLGTLEAARPVVVGGDRQGPAAEQTIVVEHQIGGGLSRAIRIQALNDDATCGSAPISGGTPRSARTREMLFSYSWARIRPS